MGLYPVVLVLAGVYLLTADPQTGLGAGFVVLVALLAPTAAAFVAASLVILLNGVYLGQGGSVDRVSLAVAIGIVAGLPPVVYLAWTMGGTRPLWLMVLSVIVSLALPLGLVEAVFDISSRIGSTMSN